MKWQEEHAFKNNTFNKGLEEDEAEFLDAVDAARQFQFENMHFTRGWWKHWLIPNICRCNAERQKVLAERAELEEFQKTQQELRERELDERIRAETRNPSIVVSYELLIERKLWTGWNSGAQVFGEASVFPAEIVGRSCEEEGWPRVKGAGQSTKGAAGSWQWSTNQGSKWYKPRKFTFQRRWRGRRTSWARRLW